MRMQKGQLAGWGFHAGEQAVQERAGVRVRHCPSRPERLSDTSRIKDSVRRNPQADRSPERAPRRKTCSQRAGLWKVSGGNASNKRKHSVDPQRRASWAREFAASVSCSSFMSRSVQSAMTTGRFVVADCIYGVVCGPRGGGGSWNWRTDGQLGA